MKLWFIGWLVSFVGCGVVRLVGWRAYLVEFCAEEGAVGKEVVREEGGCCFEDGFHL